MNAQRSNQLILIVSILLLFAFIGVIYTANTKTSSTQDTQSANSGSQQNRGINQSLQNSEPVNTTGANTTQPTLSEPESEVPEASDDATVLAGALKPSKNEEPEIDGLRLIVTGIVKDEAGMPIEGAMVQTENFYLQLAKQNEEAGQNFQATTDADGAYKLVCKAEYFQTIKATATGFGSDSKSFMFPDSMNQSGSTERRTHDFTLGEEKVILVRVQNQEGNPLSGVEVKAIKNTGAAKLINPEEIDIPTVDSTQVTDSLGVCKLYGLAKLKDYSISASRDGYTVETITTKAPHEEELTITLKRGGASIEGVVMDLDSKVGINGAEVIISLFDQGSQMLPIQRSTTTNEQGVFKFENLNPMMFSISANHPDYYSNLSISQNDPLKENEARTGVVISLNKGLTVYGVVTDAITGEPLPGVRVSPNNKLIKMMTGGAGNKQSEAYKPAITDANGAYEIRGVNSMGNMLFVKAELQGWSAIKDDSMNFPDREDTILLNFSPDEKYIEKNIEMAKQVKISGKVKTPNNIGIAGAQIFYARPDNYTNYKESSILTDRNGFYSIDVPSLSQGTIIAKVNETQIPSELIEPISTDVINVDIIVNEFTEIRGLVVDQDDQPVEGANVKFNQHIPVGVNHTYYANSTDATSDSEGKFTITNVYPIRSTAMANHPKFAPSKSENIYIMPGKEFAEVKLQLRVERKLAGFIYDSEGKQLKAANISLYATQDSYHSNQQIRTDEKGYFYADGIPVDRVTLFVYGSGTNVNHQFQDVKTDDLNVELRMPKLDIYTVIVTLKDQETNQPILDYSARSSWGQETYPVRDGVLTLAYQQENASVDVIFAAEGYAELRQSIYTSSQLDADGDYIIRHEFVLEKSVDITGIVVDETTKEPIQNVKVQVYKENVQPWEIINQRNTTVSVTNEEGRYSFTNISSGNKTFIYTPNKLSKYAKKQTTVYIPEKGGNLEVTELNYGSKLIITVVDAYTKAPKENVHLHLNTNYSIGQTSIKSTDAKGVAEFEGLSEENYQVTFGDFELLVFANITEEKDVTELTVELGSTTVKGQIIQGELPITGNVQLQSKDSVTQIFYNYETSGEKNSFEFSHLSPGKWTLRAYPPNWGRELATVDFEVTASDKDQTIIQNVELPSGVIEGKILLSDGSLYIPEKGSKNPGSVNWSLASSPTYMNDGKGVVEIQPNGTYKIEALETGIYEIVASAKGLGRGKIEVTLQTKGEQAVRDITLSGGGATIISTVLSYDTGEGLPGAWLNLTPVKDTEFSQQFTNRGADGVLVAEFIPAGTYAVEVSAWGQSINTHTITLAEGEERVLDDVLYASGALRWALKYAEGNAAGGINCRLVPLSADTIEAVRTGKTEAESGQFIVRGLFPGRYRAEALSTAGEVLASLEVEISAAALNFQTTVLP
ncbi:MAG: carboxypeptidase regulatory-like domain-containing protein [Sumerlaeia bacterium]